MSKVMVVQLQEGLPVPFSKTEKEAPNDPLKRGLEIQNIQNRIFTVPVNPGNYFRLIARENQFFFLSKKRWGFPGDEAFSPKTTAIYSLERCAIDQLTLTRVIDNVSVVYNVSHDGQFIGYLSSFAVGTIPSAQESAVGTIPSAQESAVGMGTIIWGDTRLSIEPEKEFRQILNDVWLQVRNYFYDSNVHSLPWKSIREKYAALLPYVVTRQDLNYVMGWMVGELGVSHMYVWRPGDLRRSASHFEAVACLGADISLSGGFYRLDHILQTPNDQADARNPLLAPNVKLKKGDYLLAINGNALRMMKITGNTLPDSPERKSNCLSMINPLPMAHGRLKPMDCMRIMRCDIPNGPNEITVMSGKRAADLWVIFISATAMKPDSASLNRDSAPNASATD